MDKKQIDVLLNHLSYRLSQNATQEDEVMNSSNIVDIIFKSHLIIYLYMPLFDFRI